MISKIFIGNQNISSQINDWKKGFNSNGIETLTAVSSVNSNIIGGSFDYDMSKMKQFWFGGVRPRKLQLKLQEYFKPSQRVWRKALRECDVFMFIWNSFQDDHSDYAELKRKGKKIITLFVGDDIRWAPAMQQHFKEQGIPPINYNHYDYSIQNLEKKLSYLRVAEKFSDLIISVPDQSQLALKPYKYFATIIDLEVIIENTNQSEIPLIVHAPSSREIKGTKYILQAIEELKNDGLKFDFKLLEKVAHNEALKWYTKADIVIGQLGIGLGKQGMEVLGSGTILLTGLHRICAVNDDYYRDNPAININKDNLKVKLKEIIENYSYRIELAHKGRPFIEKYHNPKEMCAQIIRMLEINELKRTYDVYPDFFREKYVPEDSSYLPVYNKWTDYVRGCNWYEKFVKRGERAGIVF